MNLLVKDLSVARAGRQLFSGVTFSVAPGECVVVRGHNGVGKSSLLSAILGHGGVEVTHGDICLDDCSLLPLLPHERAKKGVFLVHQEPPAIDGVSLAFMTRMALRELAGIEDVPTAQARIREAGEALGLSSDFAQKQLHVDMSGGEKKRAELFQVLAVRPAFALLDELDSGVDAQTRDMMLRVLAQLRSAGMGFVAVTHNDDVAARLNPTQIIAL